MELFWTNFVRFVAHHRSFKFPLTSSLISQFLTTFVLYVFGFDDRGFISLWTTVYCTGAAMWSSSVLFSEPFYSSLSTATPVPLISLPASYYTRVVSGVAHLGLFSVVLLLH